jgi:hypothetical protein
MPPARRGSEGAPPTMKPEEALRALGAVIEEGEELLRGSASASDVDIDDFDVWHSGAVATVRAALGERHLLASRLNTAGDLLIVLGAEEDFPPEHFRQRTQKALQYLREALKLISRGVAPPAHAEGTLTARDVTVNVHAPTAVVNLGQIFGEVRANAAYLAEGGHEEIAKALREVAEATRHHSELGEREKQDVAELLAVLGEQAKLQSTERRGVVIRMALAQLPRILSVASDLVTVWNTWGPVLTGYFASS